MLTTGDAAAILGISRKRVARLCAEGKLRATEVDRRWRIRSEDLHEFRQLERRPFWVTKSLLSLTPATQGARLEA